MQMLVHSSRFEHKAINPHHPAEQFKISSAWVLPLYSVACCCIGALWFAIDLGLCLHAVADALWGDLTLAARWWALFGSVFFLVHSVGGIAFLSVAIEFWREPHRLIIDGNGQLIIQNLIGRKRIAVENIQTVELELGQRYDETVSPGIRLLHSEGKVNLPLFKEHEKFLNNLKTTCPAIKIISKNLLAPPIPEVEVPKLPKAERANESNGSKSNRPTTRSHLNGLLPVQWTPS
jgi:hypothetical protein